jgi:hypothetical protein
VQAKIRQGLLSVNKDGLVTDRYGRSCPMVQWKGDAANIHKAMKQTVAGMAWVHSALTDQAQNHLDFERIMMAMFEAGDDTKEFLRYGWEQLSEVNAFAKQIKEPEGKKFNFEGVNTESDGNDVSMLMRLVGGGDMSMINNNIMLGLAGCNCACPCPYCTCPKEKIMCHTRGAIRRSASLMRSAHWICSVCLHTRWLG